MKYGYFDEQNREYVITRPDTPAPWANYLGSPEYGAIISNNAGGYSFVKSGANGRIMRYYFNQEDKPGRYVYLRDDDSKDYWSASWQPVLKDLNSYKNECRHGLGYTTISSDYSNIHTQVSYYVPQNKDYEVWHTKVTNQSQQTRHISTFGYVEFTNEDYYENDQVNLQYTLFITRTYFKGNRIVQAVNENTDKLEDNSNHRERFFGVARQPITSYNGDKQAFLGAYHSYHNPVAVENGQCDNQLNYNMNACGALHCSLTLQPGETKELTFVMGKKNAKESEQILKRYEDSNLVSQELKQLKEYWIEKLSAFHVETPDADFNHMVNTWNAYQCYITFIWSRAASLIYCGLRNGYGYRDTVQDIQGIIHLDPEMAADKIRFMLSAQVHHGAGLPLVKFTHNPGHEDTPEDLTYVQATGHPAYRADDALWLFPTIYKYICETGNKDFLDEIIPYADKNEDTVYDHLKKAISFSMNHLGNHQMPAGLYADWNDCLRLGANGESTFVAFQLYYAILILKEFAQDKKDATYIAELDSISTSLHDKIQTLCWDEDRFIRGFKEDGQMIGAKKDPEANMWLNPQSWSVISRFADEKQATTALNSVYEHLNTRYGCRLMTPSYVDHAFDGARAILFNPSTKENGGIFSQPQGWIILAEALMGHGDRAFMYFKESSPATQNDNAEVRVLEPYVHGQFTESTDSPFEGRSHVHWLTGTASTVMVGCVEGICGIRPDMNGLTLAPAFPHTFETIQMTKVFRKKKLHITINNPNHVQNGVTKLVLNGKTMESNYIPASLLEQENEITLTM